MFFKKDRFQKGQVEILIILLLILISFLLVGGLKTFQKSQGIAGSGYCCDSGDGDECQSVKSDTDQFTFGGYTYYRLKSNIRQLKGFQHLKYKGYVNPFNGRPLVFNTSSEITESLYGTPGNCGDRSHDQMYDLRLCQENDWACNFNEEGSCVAVPDEQIIYVCKEYKPAPDRVLPGISPVCDSTAFETNGMPKRGGDLVFDAYIREKPGETIPDFIKNCRKDLSAGGGQPTIMITPAQGDKKSLQMNTFKVLQDLGTVIWSSPHCKPAIYLYPKEKTDVSVKVSPIGKMLLTIPKYPQGGWNVTAHPSGEIKYKDESFDYLYYEAEIPNSDIQKPKEGFVIEYKDLRKLFDDILPRLGLNEKERKEFSEYWLRALPNSPYYFVGIVSDSNLTKIAPLAISPNPEKLIRVNLYFDPLDKKIDAQAPVIKPVERKGFTVVEWGGIFNKDKNPNFSCMM